MLNQIHIIRMSNGKNHLKCRVQYSVFPARAMGQRAREKMEPLSSRWKMTQKLCLKIQESLLCSSECGQLLLTPVKSALLQQRTLELFKEGLKLNNAAINISDQKLPPPSQQWVEAMQHKFALCNAAGGEALAWKVEWDGTALPAPPKAWTGSVQSPELRGLSQGRGWPTRLVRKPSRGACCGWMGLFTCDVWRQSLTHLAKFKK